MKNGPVTWKRAPLHWRSGGLMLREENRFEPIKNRSRKILPKSNPDGMGKELSDEEENSVHNSYSTDYHYFL